MTKLLEFLEGIAPEKSFDPGDVLIRKGEVRGDLFILKEGEVKIEIDGTPVSTISTKGSTFGEISALLGGKASATVKISIPSVFLVVEDARTFLAENNGAALEVARLLAHRVKWLTLKYVNELDDGDSVFWSSHG